MSEIFEALRKAQRDAEARGQAIESAAPPAAAAVPDHTAALRRSAWRPWRRGPAARNGHGQATSLLMAEQGTVLAEQFRVLRTHVEAAGPQALMVTSALAQEGKTLCVANLSAALARRVGAQVILIDADLRHPCAEPYFGLRGGPGLVECLLGEARWQECLRPTRFAGLQVLPAGRATNLAPELLAAERMRALAAELKAEFPQHYLLFDTPPILVTADPLVVARHMDHFILVVRAGVTPRAAVLKAVGMLGAERLLGVVFNDATESVSDYYYYSGRYPYGGRDESGS